MIQGSRIGRYRVEWCEPWSALWKFYGSYGRDDSARGAAAEIRSAGHEARIIARFEMLDDAAS